MAADPSKSPKSTSRSTEIGVPDPDTGQLPNPAGQSPEDPIEFTANSEVARGNAERANAEPEPAGLHAAKTPGVPDVAAERRRDAAKRRDGE
jgi:hypothetical protein